MSSRAVAIPETPQKPAKMLDESFGLALMEGEEVLVKGEPMRDRLLQYSIGMAVFIGIMSAGLGLLALPIVYLVARAFFAKHNYWLTSSRVVVTNGIIAPSSASPKAAPPRPLPRPSR